MKGIVEVVLVVVLMLAAPVVASINVGVIGVDGTTNNVRDVTGYATHGDDMDGMTVTAFIDGVAEPSVP